MDVKELLIPVPWGFIAAKSYGKENNPVVLAFHGVGDNSGTFDTLIPLLPPTFNYISLDLPGCGKSSPLPPYVFISDVNYIFAIKLVTNFLNLRKYILMGHCRGGQYSLVFAQLFPELIAKVIVIESIYLLMNSIDSYKEDLVHDIKTLIRINDKAIKNRPKYTHKEAIEKVISSNKYGTLTWKSGNIMAKRMLLPTTDGKYLFSGDPRLGVLRKNDFDLKSTLRFISKNPIRCPCLFVIATRSLDYFKPEEEIFKAIKQSNSYETVWKVVTGGHYIHMNSPEVVAPPIIEFLNNMPSKL